MDSGYTVPLMRSFTFLLVTTSAATVAGAQQPNPVRCRDCATTVEARAAQVRDSLRLRSGGIEAEIERVAVQLLMASQMQAQASRSLESLRSGQVAESNR